MAIDPHYIPAFSIEDVLLDKDTGAPLTGGLVYFEQDNQRGVLKPVYQITGVSPNYSYIQLPNPITLSAIGTFEDAVGNPVIPYFYPYDAKLDPEYYYIRVTNSDDVEQFTREAQPYIALSDNSEILSVISNEISNPQFIEVLFDTSNGSYTYNVNAVTDSVISIAPDWDLIVSAPGAGTITLTQLEPSGSLNILTNPGTLLTISSAGLTKLNLRQRLYGSPNLWGSGYLSASFVAKTYSGTGVTLNMYYSQSNGLVVDQLLVSANLPSSGSYASFPGSFNIPASSSTQAYPDAYIDIYFDIPLSIQIDITSVMVASTGLTSIANIAYDQESLNRQIDHLYHYAYPIVPIGTVIDFCGFVTPDHYLLCDGTAYNRISYNQLFQATSTTETVTLTSGVNTFTSASPSKYYIGMAIEGTGIAASTVISNIVTTTITMSHNATASGAKSVRFFIGGNGNGTTTFNVPNLVGCVIAGSGIPDSFTLLPNTGPGAFGGESSSTLIANNLPPHTHASPGTTTGYWCNTAAGTAAPGAGTSMISQASTGNNTTTNVAFTNIQPTVLLRKCIRYQ